MLAWVIETIGEIKGMPSGEIQAHSDLRRDIGLGSMDEVELMSLAEEHFGASIPSDSIVDLSRVEQVVDLVLGQMASGTRRG